MKNAIDELKTAFAAEQADRSAPRLATDIPLSYESITDEWLTAIICRGAPGAQVIAHRLSDPDEGNTSRRLIFLEYNTSGNAAQLPRSVFCKASHNLASRISTGICGGIYCEVTFYNHVRALLDIEAPRGIWANYNHKTMNSIVVLHDMSGEVQFCSLETDMTDERLRSQMELLSRVHARFYGQKSVDASLAELPLWPDYFSRLSLIGIQDICASGFRAAQSVIPPRLLAREADIWPATLASVARHRELPRMLIHSDVHLRNWYVTGDRGMGLNDWQGACIGHWGRDVAYAATAAMTVDKRRRFLPELLAYYLDRLHCAGGPRLSLDEATMHYRQQLFGALAWWTVTMPAPGLPAMQPLDVTLEMIRRLTHAIDDFDALDSF
jgi:Phosphotransferase enzyme family